MAKITVVGIGPGSDSDITPAAITAIKNASVIVAYKYYIRFIEHLVDTSSTIIDTGMKKERQRVEEAIFYAMRGEDVCIVSSGDAGIYGMAPLVLEMCRQMKVDIDIEIIPGISAFQKAAALLGAPMGHDFCIISLSDLMTSWELIEKRIRAAADADFVTAVYNPKSNGRYWQLHRLREIFLESRNPSTPIGFVRQAGREEETVSLTTLGKFNPDDVDMFTVVIIGNSQTFSHNGRMVTPRGYYRENEPEGTNVGQSIMIQSFRTIASELRNPHLPIDRLWPTLHAIHTTADFEMERLLKIDENAVPRIYSALTSQVKPVIITDVTMVASGIRKGALARLGIEVKCLLNEPETTILAEKEGITRSQAGIRRAVELYPDALFAFGNAPTALAELCTLIHNKIAHPCGIIAAPVGFVHVCESKHMLLPFSNIPKIIVEGRKGGSNLAATLVNSTLCWTDAAQVKPGRDV